MISPPKNLRRSTKWVACSTMGPPQTVMSHQSLFWIVLYAQAYLHKTVLKLDFQYCRHMAGQTECTSWPELSKLEISQGRKQDSVPCPDLELKSGLTASWRM